MNVLIAEYKAFSNKIMTRPNYFGFCTTIFYTSGLNAIYLLQAVTILMALCVIAVAMSTGLAVGVFILYLIAIRLRKGCSNCAEIQAFMIISGAIFSQHSAKAMTMVAILFAAWFAVWYITSKRIYDNSDNAQP